MSDFPVWTWFANSFDITVVTVVLTVVVSLLSGYALVHLRFRGRGVVFSACVSALMVPVHLRVFVSVVLPLCRPLIAVLATMSTLTTWNDFSWPLIR